jgi:hypothetical protein
MQIFHLKLYDDHSVLAPNLNLNPRNRMEKRFAESAHAQLRNRCENALEGVSSTTRKRALRARAKTWSLVKLSHY